MTFHLAYADGGAVLDSSRPIIKAHERSAFSDAIKLLTETSQLRDRANADADTARQSARSEGLAEAKIEASQAIAVGLADVAAAIDAHAQARRADIAEAAFAAARAIIGELEESDAMRGVVERTLARLDPDMPVTIDVAPVLASALRPHLATLGHVTVTENADLGPTDCHIMTASGRIIASLSVQFDALASRWGLSHAHG
jgi:flagellar biosynthesis/type III secretory pathway protein FliH